MLWTPRPPAVGSLNALQSGHATVLPIRRPRMLGPANGHYLDTSGTIGIPRVSHLRTRHLLDAVSSSGISSLWGAFGTRCEILVVSAALQIARILRRIQLSKVFALQRDHNHSSCLDAALPNGNSPGSIEARVVGHLYRTELMDLGGEQMVKWLLLVWSMIETHVLNFS